MGTFSNCYTKLSLGLFDFPEFLLLGSSNFANSFFYSSVIFVTTTPFTVVGASALLFPANLSFYYLMKSFIADCLVDFVDLGLMALITGFFLVVGIFLTVGLDTSLVLLYCFFSSAMSALSSSLCEPSLEYSANLASILHVTYFMSEAV